MTNASPETLSIVIEREIPYPPEKIWRALTLPHLIEEWLMKNDFKPEAGHHFNLNADWGSVACQVLEVEPHKTLTYTWDSKDLRSVVTWTLARTARGTFLHMEQTGFHPNQQPYYRGAKAGWLKLFDGLEEVVARAD